MKTRTIKELLILLRDYFPKSDIKERGALCFAIHDMRKVHKLITWNEEQRLDKFIHKHKPIEYNRWSPYFFKEHELAPRMEFLNKLISEL